MYICATWHFTVQKSEHPTLQYLKKNIYLLQLGCHPVAVVTLRVYKIWNWLLLNLSREGYMRNM